MSRRCMTIEIRLTRDSSHVKIVFKQLNGINIPPLKMYFYWKIIDIFKTIFAIATVYVRVYTELAKEKKSNIIFATRWRH